MSAEKARQARVMAVQALYQQDLNQDDFETFVGEFLLHHDEQDGEIKALARTLAVNTHAEQARLDRLIKAAAQNWELNRIAPVDRAILRLAVYELLCRPDVPPKAVLDEAIELAKTYSTRDAGGFVNGVLDAVLKRPDLDEYRARRELPEELA